MNPFFSELGRQVLERWKSANFSQAAFPKIAVEALEANPPCEEASLHDLVQDFLLEDDQPLQSPSGFGQPELIVYDHPRFYIQILFWLEGTTDIHQHQFSGAFHVMAGSSLHSLFEFRDAEPVSAHMKVGNLRLAETRLLETGTTCPIVSGPGYIHSLFHLDTPSVTVVIRTHNDPGTSPQFTYLPPHLAVDPLLDDTLTTRRKQLLDLLEKTHDPAYSEMVLEMLAVLDFERGFFILQNGMGYLRSVGEWETVLDAFCKKHGKLAKGIGATLDEIVRRDSLAAMRATVDDPEHRFFLALLLNVPTGTEIVAMIRKRFKGDPIQLVLRWADDLCVLAEDGAWLVDARFPATLDVPLEDQPAEMLSALRGLLLPAGKAKAVGREMREAFEKSSWKGLVGQAAGRTPNTKRQTSNAKGKKS